MESNKLKWCLKLKDGLKIMEPNERLAESYLREAKASLQRAEKNFLEGDLLWTTVVVYYAEYYSLYSFLQRIGIKCENHFCSILATSQLLGNEMTRTINKHKDKRIDAQYYMKVGGNAQVKQMLAEAKTFAAEFDNLVSNLTNEQIESHRKKFLNLIE